MNIFVIGGTFGVALIAFELLIAALTFAIVANIPSLRRLAIPAPIASVILAPCLLLIVLPFALRWTFVARGSPRGWILYALIVTLAVAASAILAKAAELLCRALFEFLPPWIHRKLGLRYDVLVRSAILVGGSLSLIVVLVIFGWLSVFSRHLEAAIGFGALGLAAAFACVRALLHLRTPEFFQPVPFPNSLKRMIFRESSSTD